MKIRLCGLAAAFILFIFSISFFFNPDASADPALGAGETPVSDPPHHYTPTPSPTPTEEPTPTPTPATPTPTPTPTPEPCEFIRVEIDRLGSGEGYANRTLSLSEIFRRSGLATQMTCIDQLINESSRNLNRNDYYFDDTVVGRF